jgi:hypothetical protein
VFFETFDAAWGNGALHAALRRWKDRERALQGAADRQAHPLRLRGDPALGAARLEPGAAPQGRARDLLRRRHVQRGRGHRSHRDRDLLRPTESAVLWTQQLGRGLRLDPANAARTLTVIDHIGNHRLSLTKPGSAGHRAEQFESFLQAVICGEHELPTSAPSPTTSRPSTSCTRSSGGAVRTMR